LTSCFYAHVVESRPETVHEQALEALVEHVFIGDHLDLIASLSRFLHRKGLENIMWRECIDRVIAHVLKMVKNKWGHTLYLCIGEKEGARH
jgi:hypothetical protein